jgi:hypothetical protein
VVLDTWRTQRKYNLSLNKFFRFVLVGTWLGHVMHNELISKLYSFNSFAFLIYLYN